MAASISRNWTAGGPDTGPDEGHQDEDGCRRCRHEEPHGNRTSQHEEPDGTAAGDSCLSANYDGSHADDEEKQRNDRRSEKVSLTAFRIPKQQFTRRSRARKWHARLEHGWECNLDLFVRSGADHRSRSDISGTQVTSVCSARAKLDNCDARILRQRRAPGEVSHRAVAGSIPIREAR